MNTQNNQPTDDKRVAAPVVVSETAETSTLSFSVRTYNKPMNPEVKKKWVEALRSGKYPQGRNRLRSEDGYCCLGVLCDVVDPKLWETCETHRNFWYDGEGHFLPDSVQMVASLEYRDPILAVSYEDMSMLFEKYAIPRSPTLSRFNDNHVPFTTIADVIEKYL